MTTMAPSGGLALAGEPTFLSVDLGAESGRILAASLKDGYVELKEIHRFANEPVELNDGLHWNVLGIFAEVKEGLRKAGEEVEGYRERRC